MPYGIIAGGTLRPTELPASGAQRENTAVSPGRSMGVGRPLAGRAPRETQAQRH